ncbi:response regulator [Nibrella viscosa]
MKNRFHVLIAEDDPFIRKVLRHALEDEFEVSTQVNGIEAMSWLEKGNPVDILVTDLQMPHMDGRELIRTVRSSPLFAKLPIIILSTFEDSNTRITCLELGADDYMTKPFNPLEVKAKITAVLRRSGIRLVNS